MPADLTQDILNSDVITLLTRAIPNPELIADATASDSDKKLTVDSNEIWEILSIYIEYTSDGNAGNRHIQLRIHDTAPNDIGRLTPGVAQAASLTRFYTFAPGLPRDSSFFATTELYFPIPQLILPPSFGIRIFDASAVSAAGDNMIVQMMINRYDV